MNGIQGFTVLKKLAGVCSVVLDVELGLLQLGSVVLITRARRGSNFSHLTRT